MPPRTLTCRPCRPTSPPPVSSDAWPASDLLLRFEDPALEAAFTRYNSEQAVKGEPPWGTPAPARQP